MINFALFSIGKKNYFVKNKNYLIIDFLNFKLKSLIIFKNVKYFFFKKNFINNFINIKIFSILLKHFYIKKISLKKKRRKNFTKKIISYKKKSLIFIQKII